MQSFLVDECHAGLRLRDFLKLKLSEYGNNELKRMINQGLAMVNSKIERFYSRRLNCNDCVAFNPARALEKLEILHNSSDFMVIDKPSGFVCTQKNFRLALHKELFMVHRLDKATSGAMVLAKTMAMKEHLERLFFERKVKKEYLALTQPFDCPSEICIDQPLLIQKVGGVKVVKVDGKGVAAKTYVRVLSQSNHACLVLARPITGRTHQIRVHLQSVNACILGDVQYSNHSCQDKITPSLMLHAKTLSFTSLDGEKQTFASRLRESFVNHMIKSEILYNEKNLTD